MEERTQLSRCNRAQRRKRTWGSWRDRLQREKASAKTIVARPNVVLYFRFCAVASGGAIHQHHTGYIYIYIYGSIHARIRRLFLLQYCPRPLRPLALEGREHLDKGWGLELDSPLTGSQDGIANLARPTLPRGPRFYIWSTGGRAHDTRQIQVKRLRGSGGGGVCERWGRRTRYSRRRK